MATAQTVEQVPGLLIALQNADGGWGLSVVQESGKLRRLIEEIAAPTYLPDFDVSASGREILYAYEGDIWHHDLSSGETKNVTQTDERDEQAPRWWPTREDSFVCGSRPVASEGPSVGYLTLVGFDGGYEVLDEERVLGAPPAPAPDGERIAYTLSPGQQDEGPFTFIYDLEGGKRLFDLAAYGVDWATKGGGVAWSPAGDRLAWSLLGVPDQELTMSLVVFNLEEETHQLLHQYVPARIGASGPVAHWGSGGNWLLFYAPAEDPEAQGLWLAELQGEARQLVKLGLSSLTRVRDPALSPDGRQVAFTTPDGEAVGLMEAGHWQVSMWQAPEKVGAVDWVTVSRPR